MANRTVAEQIEVLETRRDALETALTAQQSGAASFTIDGMSVTNHRISDISTELTRVNKSLQRLYRGGRGFVVDMSTGSGTSVSADNTVFTRVQA